MFWVRGRDNLRQYLRSKVRRRDLTVPKTGLKLSSSSTRIRFFYFQVSVLFCSKKKQRNKKIFVFFKEKNCQLKNFRGNLFLLLSLVLFRSFCAFRYQTLSLLSERVSQGFSTKTVAEIFLQKKINPTLVRTKVRCVWCASKKWTIFSSLSHTHSLSVR